MNYIFPLITAVVWGLCYTSIEKIVSVIDKKTYILLLTFLSFTTNISFIVSTHKNVNSDLNAIRYNKENIVLWLSIAIISTIIGNYLSILSVEKSSATVAAALEITYPFWCLIFSYFLLNGSVSKGVLIGSVFIFVGVLFIIKIN
jgi:drug/metabolite transporter (DMT)-like permease